MRAPWVYHSAIGKPEWQKRTPFLDLTRNLILALINPSQQMFNWHSSVLSKNNKKSGIYQQGKKSITTTQFQASWVGSLVGWLVDWLVDWFFTCFQLSGVTLRGSRDATKLPGLGVMHLYSILGLVCRRLWDSVCTLLSTARKPFSLLSAAPSCCPFGQQRDPRHTWESKHKLSPWGLMAV